MYLKELNDTYTSHLNPDAVVIGESALQVGRQLAGVNVLRQPLQARQVRLKRVGIRFCLLLSGQSCFKA